MIEADRIKYGLRFANKTIFFVPAWTPEIIADLSKRYVRLGRTNKFMVPYSLNIESIEQLFTDKIVAIVGKGPSLNNLTFIDADIILAINEAYKKVRQFNNCYLLVQDSNVHIPDAEHVIAGPVAAKHYPECNIVIPEVYTGNAFPPTALLAVRICIKAKAKFIKLYAFDAVTNGDCRYFEGTDPHNPNRFINYGQQIIEAMEGNIPYEFIEADKNMVKTTTTLCVESKTIL